MYFILLLLQVLRLGLSKMGEVIKCSQKPEDLALQHI